MPLNEKQTRFAHAYIACGGNGRAAAIQAGYSHTSAAKRPVTCSRSRRCKTSSRRTVTPS